MKTLLKAALATCVLTTAVSAQEQLEMTSAFGTNLPILGTAAVDFVERSVDAADASGDCVA